MYKALKFVYELGVRHERARIAAALEATVRTMELTHESDYYMRKLFKEKEGTEEAGRERFEFRMAVDERIQRIIKKMFEPKWEQVYGPSPMFPDGDSAGKLK